MVNHDRSYLYELKLRRPPHDQGISRQVGEHLRVATTTQRHHDLQAQSLTGLGNRTKNRRPNLSRGSQRDINQGSSIETIPGKINQRPRALVSHGTGVIDIDRSCRSRKVETFRECRYMRARREYLLKFAIRPQATPPSVLIQLPFHRTMHPEY